MDVCSLPCSTIFKTACSQEYDDLDTIIYGGWIRPIHSTEIDSVNLLKAPLFFGLIWHEASWTLGAYGSVGDI